MSITNGVIFKYIKFSTKGINKISLLCRLIMYVGIVFDLYHRDYEFSIIKLFAIVFMLSMNISAYYMDETSKNRNNLVFIQSEIISNCLSELDSLYEKVDELEAENEQLKNKITSNHI